MSNEQNVNTSNTEAAAPGEPDTGHLYCSTKPSMYFFVKHHLTGRDYMIQFKNGIYRAFGWEKKAIQDWWDEANDASRQFFTFIDENAAIELAKKHAETTGQLTRAHQGSMHSNAQGESLEAAKRLASAQALQSLGLKPAIGQPTLDPIGDVSKGIPGQLAAQDANFIITTDVKLDKPTMVATVHEPVRSPFTMKTPTRS